MESISINPYRLASSSPLRSTRSISPVWPSSPPQGNTFEKEEEKEEEEEEEEEESEEEEEDYSNDLVELKDSGPSLIQYNIPLRKKMSRERKALKDIMATIKKYNISLTRLMRIWNQEVASDSNYMDIKEYPIWSTPAKRKKAFVKHYVLKLFDLCI